MIRCRISKLPLRYISVSNTVFKTGGWGVNFTGNDLWWSVRAGGLNQELKGIASESFLRQRTDFWEDTIYGHGGDAKIFAGLKYGNFWY